jgi:hypothetical protein
MRNYEQPESDCPEVIINKPDLQEHKEVIIRQGAVIEDLQEQLADAKKNEAPKVRSLKFGDRQDGTRRNDSEPGQ